VCSEIRGALGVSRQREMVSSAIDLFAIYPSDLATGTAIYGQASSALACIIAAAIPDYGIPEIAYLK